MFAYFDIETTGLTAEADFVCAVVIVGDEVHTFAKLDDVVAWLLASTETIVSWNGLSFDFKFLSDRVADELVRARLAWVALHRHLDLMLDFTVDHGFPTSMQSVATPLGLAKTWTGEEAADSEDFIKVLEYCTNDVRVLKTIHETGALQHWLHRHSAAGKRSVWVLPATGFRDTSSCLAALAKTPPDQGWMSSPFNIAGTAEWALAALRPALR